MELQIDLGDLERIWEQKCEVWMKHCGLVLDVREHESLLVYLAPAGLPD